MPNISTTKETCARECRKTWRNEYGGSVPGGPFPGTHAQPGDVRRCDHGKYWEYAPDATPLGDYTFDHWNRLDWSTPIRLHRAKSALAKHERTGA